MHAHRFGEEEAQKKFGAAWEDSDSRFYGVLMRIKPHGGREKFWCQFDGDDYEVPTLKSHVHLDRSHAETEANADPDDADPTIAEDDPAGEDSEEEESDDEDPEPPSAVTEKYSWSVQSPKQTKIEWVRVTRIQNARKEANFGGTIHSDPSN